MTISTLFLNYVTCIDYAVIGPDEGKITGGSYSPIIEVTGEIDDCEKVVIDFSTVKKDIKNLIDSKTDGFDHKLWYVPGYSACIKNDFNERTTEISSTSTFIRLPSNAVKSFELQFKNSLIETAENEMSEYLTKNLGQLHPEANVKVSVRLSDSPSIPVTNGWNFTYTHGLKDSTSWGCQNIAHGHNSFIDFAINTLKGNDWSVFSYELSQCVREINDSVFINRENVVGESDKIMTISYQTERGNFLASYNKKYYNLIVLDTETTVEYIADWFVKTNMQCLKSAGVERVFVSEGLSKGAVVTL